MNDFVTRLEAELHQAALRRESTGALRGAALPRLRMGLRAVPAAAVASALLGLAVLGVAVMLSSSPERAAHGGVPSELRGTWRAPPTELRLYAAGSQRCVNLGFGSSGACYTIGNAATRVADEWGTLSVAGDELTLHATQHATPGVYKWRFEQGSLRLTKLRDRLATRAKALVTTPLTYVPRREIMGRVPSRWTQHAFVSKRFGYSIHGPHNWTLDTSGPADRFSYTPSPLPALAVEAQDLAQGTSAARWGVIVDSRLEASGCAPHDFRRFFVDGEKVRISVYSDCHGRSLESASFVHHGRGYRVLWRGAAARPERDYPFVDAMLKSIVFSP